MGLSRRLNWHRSRFQVNNPVVGRVVELFGNRVRMDGLTYSVDCPQISTPHKSTLAFGLHEIDERTLIGRWLPSDVPVLEFGGGLGVVSCLVNSKLDEPENHIVVEANPAMVTILQRNRRINGCKFQVVSKAISYGCDHVDLNVDEQFVGSSVKGMSSGKTVRVETTSVTDLLIHGGFANAGIVCDIEGSEADIIRRELPALGDRIRFFMTEMHPKILGQQVVNDLMADLTDLGFMLKEQIGDSVFYIREP